MGHSVRLPPKALSCYKGQKKIFFYEFWNNSSPFLLFIRLSYKYVKHDTKGESLKLLRASKRNCFLEYDALSLSYLFSNFLLWFHKIVKLVFHKQLSCPKKYVLKIEEDYLTWHLWSKFSYNFRASIKIVESGIELSPR